MSGNLLIDVHVGFNGTDIACHLKDFAAAHDFLARAEMEIRKSLAELGEQVQPAQVVMGQPSNALERARLLLAQSERNKDNGR